MRSSPYGEAQALRISWDIHFRFRSIGLFHRLGIALTNGLFLQPSLCFPSHSKEISTFLIEHRYSKKSIDGFQIITAFHCTDSEEPGISPRSKVLTEADAAASKSQIAIEYAYRFRLARPQSHVFWMHAATSATILQGFNDIARKLQLTKCDDRNSDLYELVSKWLHEEKHSWLMILDNADDADLFHHSNGSDTPYDPLLPSWKPLIEYLPSVMGSQRFLLVTTRNRLVGQNLALGEQCVEVPPLSCAEAKNLLQKKAKRVRCPFNEPTLDELVDVLGYMPLAISQAAAFMDQTSLTADGYLAAMKKGDQNMTDFLTQELQDHRRPRGFPNSVFRTWKISFDQILEKKPQAAEMLSLIAMLHPRRIPKNLLQSSFKKEIDFHMAIGTLDGFALITTEIERKLYSIHPLIQASVQYWLEQRNGKASYASEALKLMAKEFPFDEYGERKMCELMLPHAQTVLCFKCSLNDDLTCRAGLLYKMAKFSVSYGRYASAYQECLEAYTIYREQLGNNELKTLKSLELQAIVRHYQTRYEEAESMCRQVLQSKKETLGDEHIDTLKSISNLACMFLSQKKYEEAEHMHR